MQWKYKAVMFLTLLIFCVGSVCATDPDPTDPIIKKLAEDNAQLNIKVYNQSKEINYLKDNNIQLDKRVKALENSSAEKDVKINKLNNAINELKNTVNNQNSIINNLKTDNEVLNNKIDNQNSIINNQSVIINELNNKLDLQSIEIHTLQADKDKLNAEIKEIYKEKDKIYEKLLSSPKKEDFEQLKKDITTKNNKIKELNVKINKLNSLLSVSGNDVVNSLKHLSSTNIQNIKCGQYTFSLDEYLKIPLIKYGKDRVIKYKNSHGRLPNYVTIAGYDVPKNVYQKLFSIK